MASFLCSQYALHFSCKQWGCCCCWGGSQQCKNEMYLTNQKCDTIYTPYEKVCQLWHFLMFQTNFECIWVCLTHFIFYSKRKTIRSMLLLEDSFIYSLIVEIFGVWIPFAKDMLKDIASYKDHSMKWSASEGFSEFNTASKQLSVCLWRYDAKITCPLLLSFPSSGGGNCQFLIFNFTTEFHS